MPENDRPPPVTRVLLRDQGLVPALMDAAINAAIAWALLDGAVPLWPESDEMAVGPDLLITAVLLPVLTALITERVVRWQVGRGDLPRVESARYAGPARRPAFVRGLLVAAASLVLAAGPTVAVFAAAGFAPLSPAGFIAFKAAWAAALGFAVTPPIAWWAWVRASRDAVAAERATAAG